MRTAHRLPFACCAGHSPPPAPVASSTSPERARAALGPPSRRARTSVLLLPLALLGDRELLGLRVQMAEPERAGRLLSGEPEDVQTLGDVRLVDEVVVPVGGPGPTEVLRHDRRRVGPGQ